MLWPVQRSFVASVFANCSKEIPGMKSRCIVHCAIFVESVVFVTFVGERMNLGHMEEE